MCEKADGGMVDLITAMLVPGGPVFGGEILCLFVVSRSLCNGGCPDAAAFGTTVTSHFSSTLDGSRNGTNGTMVVPQHGFFFGSIVTLFLSTPHEPHDVELGTCAQLCLTRPGEFK